MKTVSLRKRVLILMLSVILGMFAINSFAQFGGGNGSEDSPWQVGNIEHLELLRNYLGAQHADKYFIQTANIDIGGIANWEPIAPLAASSFHGKYNGDGYEIRNLRRANRLGNFGFFGFLGDGCVLENVHIRDANIVVNNTSGIFAAQAIGTQIIDCSGSGALNTLNSPSAGMIANTSGNTNIKRCWMDISINDTGSSGRQAAFVSQFNSTGTISECYALVDISARGYNQPTAAGFVGTLANGSIENCYVIGSIETTRPEGRIGGFVGDNSNRPITNCYAIVSIETEGPGPLGGFIAQGGAGNVNSCYWNDELSGVPTSPGGGEPLTTAEMLDRDSFVRWDFEGDDPVWKIDQHSIPYLAWEGDEAPDHCFPPLTLPPSRLVAVGGEEVVNLTWDRPSVTAPSGYNVYRDRNRINVNLVEEERYADNTVENFNQYTYYVTAVYGLVDESEPSGSVSATPHGFEGNGSIEDPFLVSNVIEFNAVRYFKNSYFRQVEDLDLGVAPWNEGQGWVPFSDNTNQFTGNYNGDGYVIKGLTINRNEAYQSLFGYGSAATVTGVRMEDVEMTGGYYTGAIFSYTANSNVRNCSVSGSVKGTYYMGGITGYMSGGSITNCYMTGEVVVPGTSATGYIGGFVGYYTNNANLINCYSTAMVKANQTRIGGLIGYKSGNITNCYCTGAIIAVNEIEHVGALVGQHVAGAVSNSFWNTETTGRDASPGGGTGTGTSQMVRRGTYTDVNWEFPDVWDIVEGETYPFLGWEDGPSFHNRPGPSGLTADGDHEAREIALEWNMIGNPNRYNIYRNNVLLTSVNHPTTEYVNRGLDLFVEYNYYVEAVFVVGDEEQISAPSNPVMVILAPPFAGGDGTSDRPYQVANESHLRMLRYFPAAHFIQTAHLDLHREAWTPIGDNNARFRGSFDGNGFTISEMNINTTTAYQGLFGYTQGATLRNITLEDVDLRMGQYSGALVGRSESTNISNVNITGTIQAVMVCHQLILSTTVPLVAQ